MCPEESGRMTLNFAVIRHWGLFFAVSLPKKGRLFKLSLVGRGKDLGYNGREKFSHHE